MRLGNPILLVAVASFGAASITLLPTTVKAQTGSHIDFSPAEIRDGDEGDKDAARRVTNDFGECLVKKYGRAAERAVALPAGVQSSKMLASLATADCLMDGELRMPPMLIRGAVFRALYLQKYRRVAPVGPPEVVNYAVQADPKASNDDFSRRNAALLTMGSCVARSNRDAARAFVVSAVETRAERAAITALLPALSGCLPLNLTVKFSKAVLQSVLAEVLYREASRSPDGVAVAGKK